MLERELSAAIYLARQAGEVLKHRQNEGLVVEHKANREVVTAADREADATIRAGLEAAFPADGLWTEETPDDGSRLGRRRVWIVDPLDSTSNFVAGRDEWTVSIGLAVDGVAILGVVFNPVRDEMFSGRSGEGAALNGSSARVTAVDDRSRARVVVSTKEWLRGLPCLPGDLYVHCLSSMAYKLARVGVGIEDGVVSAKRRKEWGTCAGVALVSAGGGVVSDLDGGPIGFNQRAGLRPRGLVAAGAALHGPLLGSLLRPSSSRHTPGE